MARVINNLIRNLKKHFFEYCCIVCHDVLPNRKAICFKCSKEMNTIDQSSVCNKCGRYCLTEVCYFCATNPPLFTQAKAFCIYGLESSKLIKSFKYYNNTVAEDFIFEKLVYLFNTHFNNKKIDMVVPVPMNSLKEWWKGYNHSAKITKKLSKYLNLQHFPYLIKRRFSLKRQAMATKNERIANIKNVFKINGNCMGKNILLVDDVVTTSATANECTKVLLNAGAKSVFLLTFAKSITDEKIQDSSVF